ncbi:MAG: hypothetical protein JWN48_4877 [Myxococcaceae bacterium]|nr:hypothetical protein [Myxococcaceae bacterium]
MKTQLWWACSLAVALGGCAKLEPEKRAPSEHADGTPSGMRDLPHLETPEPSSEAHPLTASEVPLTEDFATAADKRVTPDNYRQELATIEKELEQLKTKP